MPTARGKIIFKKSLPEIFTPVPEKYNFIKDSLCLSVALVYLSAKEMSPSVYSDPCKLRIMSDSTVLVCI